MKERNLSVAVIGAAGLVGGELLRLLAVHPYVSSIRAFSKSHAGRPVSDAHPTMLHAPSMTFENGVADPADLADQGIDVCFLALGHGESQRLITRKMLDSKLLVIDLAADFRIRDRAAWESAYGPHSAFELGASFVYGLPELFRERIAAARHIANPGCFATACELLLLPAAEMGLLNELQPVFAVTGSTGSGAKPKTTTHHPFRDGNMFAYKILSHQHEPEIVQCLSDAAGSRAGIRLLAHSGPFVRGIHATTYFNDSRLDGIDLAAAYDERFAGHPFVLVRREPPNLAHVNGTNFVHVHVAQAGREAEICVVMDNMMKGAAGQAVQNMNISSGLPETAGLMHTGAFPC